MLSLLLGVIPLLTLSPLLWPPLRLLSSTDTCVRRSLATLLSLSRCSTSATPRPAPSCSASTSGRPRRLRRRTWLLPFRRGRRPAAVRELCPQVEAAAGRTKERR